MTDQKAQMNDLPHCPQVFGHLLVTCVFFPQYFANFSHCVESSSHTARVGASTVVDVASVSGTAEKQYLGSIFYYDQFHLNVFSSFY